MDLSPYTRPDHQHATSRILRHSTLFFQFTPEENKVIFLGDPAPSIHCGKTQEDTGGHNNHTGGEKEEIHRGVLWWLFLSESAQFWQVTTLACRSSRNRIRNRLFAAGILISHRSGRPMAVLVRGACAPNLVSSIPVFSLQLGEKFFRLLMRLLHKHWRRTFSVRDSGVVPFCSYLLLSFFFMLSSSPFSGFWLSM